MVKVSVIMGVYNTKKEYLVKAIESILSQTYKDFEFIICNDCCTDDTYKFMKKKYNDKRIIWLENETNRGLAYTLNHCLEFAKGEYIARMDTDDYSVQNRFEKQVEYLDNHKDVDLVSSCCNVFDENGIYGERIYKSEVEKKDFIFNSPIVHPSIMVRKKSLDKVNGYRDIKKTYRVEDYDLFMRMMIAGQKMYIIQEKLLDYRENRDTIARRKYRYRINEYKIRFENFSKMGFLPKYYIFCLKPLFVGLIPSFLLKKVRNKNR